SAQPPTRAGSRVFFTAGDSATGLELWSTDGTAAGTALVRDIAAGTAAAWPRTFAALGSRVFFVAADAAHGPELRVSDGTAAGTPMVKDVTPGSTGTSITQAVAAGGKLFFVANTELWVSDGTAAGTFRPLDINPAGNDWANALTAVGDFVYFMASDGA